VSSSFQTLALKGSNVKQHCESKHLDQLMLLTDKHAAEFVRRKKQLLFQLSSLVSQAKTAQVISSGTM
jgi:hypothetical protein